MGRLRRFFGHPAFLPTYAGLLTVALIAMLIWPRASFREIDVQRINLREPDGTLRLVLSNNAAFPGAWVAGHEYPHDARKADRTAGLLFFDGDGTESGGLIFGGQKDAAGRAVRFGHLSFDKHDQDQLIALEGGDADGKPSSSIVFNDQPDWPIAELLAREAEWQRLPAAERRAAEQAFIDQRGRSHRRAVLGRVEDQSSVLDLRDAAGRTRLVARVTADGTATLQSLDAQGRVVAQWPPAAP